jgi:precorrin-6B methylase 2
MQRPRPESDVRPPEAAHGLPLHRWHAWDDLSTELEVSALVGGLVMGLQPTVAVELGCHHGTTTVQIGMALRQSGEGHLTAIDTDPQRVAITRAVTAGLPVIVEQADAMKWPLPPRVDFCFVDHGDPKDRAGILPRLLKCMTPRGVIVWHDTGDQFPLRKQLDSVWPGTGWRMIYLATSRGVGVMSRWPEPTRTLVV